MFFWRGQFAKLLIWLVAGGIPAQPYFQLHCDCACRPVDCTTFSPCPQTDECQHHCHSGCCELELADLSSCKGLQPSIIGCFWEDLISSIGMNPCECPQKCDCQQKHDKSFVLSATSSKIVDFVCTAIFVSESREILCIDGEKLRYRWHPSTYFLNSSTCRTCAVLCRFHS